MAKSDFLDQKSELGYGKLNPIHKPVIRQHFTSKSMNRRSAVDMMREASYKTIYGVNALENAGPFKAIVLHVYEGGNKYPAGSNIASLAKALGHGGAENTVVIRARIPELHGHLPDPHVDAANRSEEYYLRLAEMHQEFVGTNIASADIPRRGEIVYVDFGDKVNFSDGIYIGKMTDGPNSSVATNPIKKTSKEIYEENRKDDTTLRAQSAGGPMGEKKKEPTEDRQREYVQDGEVRIAEDNGRTSEVINFEYRDGIEIPERLFGRFKRNRSAVTIHWGGSSPENVADILTRRGLSTHVGIFKDKIYQYGDFKRGGAHAKGANRSIGVDITQHPEPDWLERSLKQGLDVKIIDNPAWEEFSPRRRKLSKMERQVLNLDYRTAQTVREFILDMHEIMDIPLRVPRNKDGSYRFDTFSPAELDEFLKEGGFLGHFHSSERKWDIAPWWAQIFDGIPGLQ